MMKAMILVSVLLLSWSWTLQGIGFPLDIGDKALKEADDATEDAKVSVVNAILTTEAPFNATEACHEAPETGPCRAYTEKYFYNSTSMSCQVFIFGGCMGNQNNFEQEDECMEKCHNKE